MNYGVLQTEQIMTLHSIKHIPEKAWNISDPETNERYIPYVIEPSLALTVSHLRFYVTLMTKKLLMKKILSYCNATTSVSAPYKAAILPLSKKLGEKAEEVRAMLSKHFMVEYDDAGSIGKRYRRQDEIGTPFCITYDFYSLKTNVLRFVTVIPCNKNALQR